MEFVLFVRNGRDGADPWHAWLQWDGNEVELVKLQKMIDARCRDRDTRWFGYQVTETFEAEAAVSTLIQYGAGGLGEYGSLRCLLEGTFTCPESLDFDRFMPQLAGCFKQTGDVEPQAAERLVRLFSWEPDYGFCERNVHTNQELARALEKARRRVCAYIGGGVGGCDCKYGARPEGNRGSSEKTGCPELREVINRLLRRPETFVESAS